MSDNSFCVIKRNGSKEEVSFDKVTRRIKKLCVGLSTDINPILIAQKVCSQIYNNVTTVELDELAAQICIAMETTNLDYGILASRIIISNNHKCTSPSFSETIYILYNNKDIHGKKCPLIADDIYEIVMKNKDKINAVLNYERDYLFDYFGFKTLEKAYLMKCNQKIVERIQHLFMRVSLGIHKDDLKSAIQSYELMSQKYFTHATPTLYNAGSTKSALASCFLLGMDDSVKGIYKTISDCAEISACAGGIGLCLSKIRSKNSYIRGTNGTSNGIVPLCRVLNETARHINQSGKRPGSIAVYIEPHNVEILEFLELRKNTGAETERARDLFLALWISDLFMKRVESNLDWSLFDSDECPGLDKLYGDDFEELYTKYESEGRARKIIPARKIWNYILTSQIETGVPYITFKDNVNKKSNQSNIGTITNSNLCVVGETLILTDNGYEEIKNLENKNINVWNGLEFTNTIVRKTGENQKIIKVILSDGCELECTEYHKFFIEQKYINKSNLNIDVLKSINVLKIDAKDLKQDMKLVKCDFPVIKNFNQEEEILFKYAYTAGFHSGDGTYNYSNTDQETKCGYKNIPNSAYCKRHQMYHKDDLVDNMCNAISRKRIPIVSLYGDKIKLLEHLHYYKAGNITKENKINVILYDCIPEKFSVPLNCSVKTKLEWLAGLADADGAILNNYDLQSIQISSINKIFLMNIKLMLNTLGCQTKVLKLSDSQTRFLPDGKGGNKEYLCQTAYRLIINGTSLSKLINLGFDTKRLELNKLISNKRNPDKFVKVIDVIDNNKYADTYCFTEQNRNAGIFNGVLTGNCNEIVQYCDSTEYAVCTLASVSLPNFVKENTNGELYYDFEKLVEVAGVMTRNLNKIIDINYYPVPETRKSALRQRAIGIGVQGLADVYAKMGYAFDSNEARELNKLIFESLYYGAITMSHNLALETQPHIDFIGSPMSQGKFQFDLWNVKPTNRYDWESLRTNIMKNGIANSLLIALMPTASTSQILGNNECFEPFTSNMYSRRTIAGDFIVINKYLVKDLMKIGLWDIKMKNKIISKNGSVQNIDEIPQNIKNLYKTVWEIKQKVLIDQAIDRAPFVCQTQSMNLFFEEPTQGILTSALFHGWKNGLKTGSYYIRTKPKAQAQQFTIDPSLNNNFNKNNDSNTENNYEVCELCSA
jgi:ribonucleoside-diphosphate reductase alpha chain